MKQIFVVIALISALSGVAHGAPSLSHQGRRFEGLLPTLTELCTVEERIQLPPSPGNFSELRYLLWTRSNPGDEEYYVMEPLDLDNLLNSNFSGVLEKTFVLLPGWGSSGTTGWALGGKTHLLNMMDCNVISVDWGLVVPGPNYFDDVDMMYRVADSNAQLLDWLIAETELTVDRIEMTGHSLGAHSAGMTSFYMTSGRVSRITGLDPAGPCFYNKPLDQSLDKSDADFVDIIHSNGCPAYDACYGTGEILGHVDFFPNGGRHQPLCVLDNNSTGPHILDISGCSHGKAPEYWVESLSYAEDPVDKLDFKSWPCSDWETFEAGECATCDQGCLSMGYNTNRTFEGQYYLSTRGRAPHAIGDDQGI